MKTFFSLTIALFFLIALSAQDIIPYTKAKTTGKYYIYAPNGLNLRKGSSVSAEKIMTIYYGEEVEIISPASNRDLVVDNLPGGMSKIKYKDQEGYIFDGYLSSFPTPQKDKDIRSYVELLRNKTLSGALYEKCERDYDGHYHQEDVLIVRVNDWTEAYFMARSLFWLPEKIYFPKASKTESETFKNPEKNSIAWEDNLTIKRDQQGNPISMHWYYRTEGSGKTASITIDELQNGLRIGLVLISD